MRLKKGFWNTDLDNLYLKYSAVKCVLRVRFAWPWPGSPWSWSCCSEQRRLSTAPPTSSSSLSSCHSSIGTAPSVNRLGTLCCWSWPPPPVTRLWPATSPRTPTSARWVKDMCKNKNILPFKVSGLYIPLIHTTYMEKQIVISDRITLNTCISMNIRG